MENGCRLPLSHIVTTDTISDACTLANILAIVKAQSEKVPGERLKIGLLVDNLATAIKDDSTLTERTQGKLFFLIEQFRLATTSPYGRRYSLNLLAFTLVWEISNLSLYKQMLKEDILSLPCIRHLHSLSKTFCMDTGLTNSTQSYEGCPKSNATCPLNTIHLVTDGF